jgi:hypothetical protein
MGGVITRLDQDKDLTLNSSKRHTSRLNSKRVSIKNY